MKSLRSVKSITNLLVTRWSFLLLGFEAGCSFLKAFLLNLQNVKNAHKMALPVMQTKDSVHPNNEFNDVIR